ncbi:MAG: T9SS type A sorting domain-containing protein [Bacteroidia bacterium]|nr:T9SS type A sorting domain-containing protein [Bacteroidia bacterium]
MKTSILQCGNFGENTNEIVQFIIANEAPLPGGNYLESKKIVNKQRQEYYRKLYKSGNYKTTDDELLPEIDTSFDGQATGSRGIPNDNHIAVSNEGKIISVQNSSIRVLDEFGKTLMFKSLYAFANGKILGFTNYCYDPKVLYDPIADRFILFFLHESKVISSFGVIAFSKTNDPTGEWNYYKIPGNPLKNDKWSDYPILSLSKDEVFLTLNLLSENKDWRDGFNQSVIWQISKNEGYNGDTLVQKMYYDIKFKSKSIWSICPVQGNFDSTINENYFLSVRPGDLENDTLFLHKISNTVKSGKSTYSLKILKTDKKYGLPPAVPQPKGGDTLQTNDCRVLGAILHKNKIQYVQTTVIKPYFGSGIFHGIFDIKTLNTVKSKYISSDSIDYAYPSICYAGDGSNSDQSSVITFSHVSSKSFPGTSAVFHTKASNLISKFSQVLKVKDGEANIERLPSSQVKHERWGDYTGIQRQFSKPNIIWLAGSYGNKSQFNGTWIGKLRVIDKVEIENILKTYPNPSSSNITIGVNCDTEQLLNIQLFNDKGKIIASVFKGKSAVGYNEFIFDISMLSHGFYYVRVYDETNSKYYSEKIIR